MFAKRLPFFGWGRPHGFYALISLPLQFCVYRSWSTLVSIESHPFIVLGRWLSNTRADAAQLSDIPIRKVKESLVLNQTIRATNESKEQTVAIPTMTKFWMFDFMIICFRVFKWKNKNEIINLLLLAFLLSIAGCQTER